MAKLFRSNPSQWRPRGNRNLDKPFRPQRVIIAKDGSTRIEPLDAMYTYMSPEGPKPVNTTGCFGTVSTFGGLNHLSIITKGKSGRRRDKVKKRGGKKYDPDWSALLDRRRLIHLRIIRNQASQWETQRFLALTDKVRVEMPTLYSKMIRADLAREASLHGEMRD